MNFTNFDLNLLRILDALLSTGSTTRAAEKVGLSQPAVSAALGRLRHALGDPLFLRQGRSLVPTDYAVSLAGPVNDLLARTQTVLSPRAAFDPCRSGRVFRIAGSDYYGEIGIPQLMQALGGMGAGVRVQMINLVPGALEGALERYECDLAIVPRIDPPGWFDWQPLFEAEFVVITRSGHPATQQAGLAPGDTLPMETYCALGHVIFSPDGALEAVGDTALRAVGRQRRVVLSLPMFGAVARTVATTDLVALFPAPLARSMAARLGLALFAPPMTVPPVQNGLFWHKRSSNDPGHQWLRGALSRILRQDSAP